MMSQLHRINRKDFEGKVNGPATKHLTASVGLAEMDGLEWIYPTKTLNRYGGGIWVLGAVYGAIS